MPKPCPALALAANLGLATLLTAATALADDSESAPAPAAETAAATDGDALPVVQVSALALGEDPNAIAMPYSIIDHDSLLKNGQGTLGDALAGLPGVHSDNFGGGASRPVIRGQSAPRTKVLADGASILDASDISPDHATTVDPLLARRIEVLRGPATLLYGSGAVGGVVNILDGKVPARMPEGGIDASLVVRGNSVARERAAAVDLTAQLGSSIAFHVEHSTRDADDYRVPGWAHSRVDGSAAASANSAVGFSWITPQGHIGIAYSHRDDDYGLPGHNHEYEGCHPHGDQLHCEEHDHGGGDGDHDHDHEHEAPPTIDLVSRRIDLRGEYTEPFAGAGRIRFRLSDTDYRHREIDDGETTTTFINRGQEGRIEIEHVPLGDWTGVIGLQHADTTFSADGMEAFMPKVDTRSTGLFLVEHYQLNEAWHFELGSRYERLEHKPIDDPRGRPAFKDSAVSFAGAAIWEFAPGYSITLSAARSQRLPHAQELFARGIHLATNTYECGLLPSALTCGGAANDAAIDTETSRNVELTLRRTIGDFSFSLGGFRND
ncbi:MAG TPA: TonB-dependent receptor, partial [Dokdonella sp.]|nr:TonB-dependent receptor [Dokdonella sp.]